MGIEDLFAKELFAGNLKLAKLCDFQVVCIMLWETIGRRCSTCSKVYK